MNGTTSAAVTLSGIALISIGASAYGWQFGFLAAGALLLLSVKSLWGWIK